MAEQPDQFKSRLWRFNGYVIAAAGVIGILVGAVALYGIGASLFGHRFAGNLVTAPQTNSDTASAPGPALDINRFDPIAGTNILWAPVVSSEDRRLRYYSKTASGIRNYIFYDVKTGAQHRLLRDNNGLIVDTRKIRQTHGLLGDPTRPSQSIDSSSRPFALLFVLIGKDSDGDGLLSRTDANTLLLTRPDGTGVTRLKLPFKTLLGQRIASKKELVVMLETDSGVKAVHISLTDFKVLRQVDIAN